ncbi:MAG: carbohydrate porin [Verrucomicrobiota bacterium]
MNKFGSTLRVGVLLLAAGIARAQTIEPSPVPQRGPVEPIAGYFFTGTTGTGAARQVDPTTTPEESATEIWWNGKGLLQGEGNPFFDARKSLEERGLKFTGNYQGAFFGVLASQGGARGFWNEQISFGSELNFGKLLGIEALEGTTAFGNFRYRDSWPQSNPNEFVEANSMFSPTNWLSGTQFRVMSFGLEAGTKNLFSVEDMILLRAGWLQPQREFIDQPLSKLFLNTAINSNKGVGGNIPFSSSFTTWGGTLKLKFHETIYWKNGLFMSYPQATSSTNHGLAYQGFAPDTSLNGLFYMGELGFTPKFGTSELEGKYAFGGYYYGTPQNQTTTWSGNKVDGRYGFYFQADQMLYRESSAPSKSSVASDGKGFKEVAPVEKPKLSKQGLSTFNLITMAPGFATANNYPFYFQSGLVYTGLIPGRDKDLAMIAIGYGAYQGGVYNPSQSYTAVIEGGYRFQINGWSYVQPFFQYFSRPDGTSEVANAAVLGFLTGLVF